MDKLGFTFYPKDWWTSESYFELTPIQRYYYLECLFIMYSNDGYMKTQKTQFENRTRTMVSDLDWEIITSKFILEKDLFTHISVNKRMRKSVANRENGKKGGRPPKYEEKPKKPKDETQKNPPLESERETEIETITFVVDADRHKSFKEQCLEDQQWKEAIFMQKVLKPETIEFALNDYNIHLIQQSEIKNSIKDYKSHFVNWVKKKKELNQKTENKDRL